VTPEEFDTHVDHDHVAAVFTARGSAEDAVVALRAHGLGSEHLGVAVHDDNRVDFEHDAESEMIHDAEAGIATGAPLGALAGFIIAALASTGFGVIGVGGVLALSGASALWGGLLGGYLGTAVGDVGWEEHQEFGYVALEPGEVLVVVCSHGQPDVVRELMQSNGGRLISKGASVG
jgi:hypothetical protein